jgi:hypothetical protein
MAQSFLQRLFGQRKRNRSELKSQEPQPKVQDVPPAAKRNSLFDFWQIKDVVGKWTDLCK